MTRRIPWGRIAAVTLVAWALACRATPEAGIRTTVLSRAAGGEAFEPTLAIDPANPTRMVVAAMYGVPFGRGATGIWLWRSEDGGLTWTDGRLDPPHWPGVTEATSAADVIAQFAIDGSQVVASMAGADPDPGGSFVSRFTPGAAPAGLVEPYPNVKDSATGRTTLHDKPWLVVDHGERSPHRGSVYFSNGAIVMDPGPAGIGKGWNGPLRSRLMLSYSRDGGQTFSTPALVADSGFGGNLAVDAAGSLGISYVRIKTKTGGADSVLFRRSKDGGVTLDPPEVVAAMTGDTLLELAVLAARPNGDLLDCWAQGDRSQERTNQVRCALWTAGGSWTPVRGLDSVIGPGVGPRLPGRRRHSPGLVSAALLGGSGPDRSGPVSQPGRNGVRQGCDPRHLGGTRHRSVLRGGGYPVPAKPDRRLLDRRLRDARGPGRPARGGLCPAESYRLAERLRRGLRDHAGRTEGLTPEGGYLRCRESNTQWRLNPWARDGGGGLLELGNGFRILARFEEAISDQIPHSHLGRPMIRVTPPALRTEWTA